MSCPLLYFKIFKTVEERFIFISYKYHYFTRLISYKIYIDVSKLCIRNIQKYTCVIQILCAFIFNFRLVLRNIKSNTNDIDS